jgi:hypothetical protein
MFFVPIPGLSADLSVHCSDYHPPEPPYRLESHADRPVLEGDINNVDSAGFDRSGSSVISIGISIEATALDEEID